MAHDQCTLNLCLRICRDWKRQGVNFDLMRSIERPMDKMKTSVFCHIGGGGLN